MWHSVRPAGAAPTRVLPDGCIDLIRSSVAGLLIAGPDTTAQPHLSREIRDLAGVRLAVLVPPGGPTGPRRPSS